MMREQVGRSPGVWRWNFATGGGRRLAVLGVLAALGSAGIATAAEPVASGEPARPGASSLDKPSTRGAIARELSTRRRAEDAQTAGKPASPAGARANEDGPTLCDGSKL